MAHPDPVPDWGRLIDCERNRPDKTLLYEVVQQNLETFLSNPIRSGRLHRKLLQRPSSAFIAGLREPGSVRAEAAPGPGQAHSLETHRKPVPPSNASATTHRICWGLNWRMRVFEGPRLRMQINDSIEEVVEPAGIERRSDPMKGGTCGQDRCLSEGPNKKTVVSIYSRAEYIPYDLDFISAGLPPKVTGAMESLGFEKT